MAYCFKCRVNVGKGGIVTEDGRLLCPRCEAKDKEKEQRAEVVPKAMVVLNQPLSKLISEWTLPQKWLGLTLAISSVATFFYCNGHCEESELAWLLVFLTNCLGWAFVVGVFLLIYKALRS